MTEQKTTIVEIPASAKMALRVTEPVAAQLTEDGHWAETQVIQSIKEATLRHKSPQRVLQGTATVPIGHVHHRALGGSEVGRLLRTRWNPKHEYTQT